jgi:predicted transposase/invertase (TIGR01784 family)
MVTDQLFYRLFATSPESFFLLLGLTSEKAREMAAKYQFQAIEFKETSQRSDGAFLPRAPGLPLYFVEVQFYRLPNIYANILAKAFTYLKQNDPGQYFRAVVVFASRSLEPTELGPYQAMMNEKQILPLYLEELDEPPDAPIGLSILSLIRRQEDEAPNRARELISRVKAEIADEAVRRDLIQFIETVILYKLPRMSREEIQAMLHVHDIRETRVYQEALQEGRQEGRAEGRQEGRQEVLAQAISGMMQIHIPVEKIAEVLKIDVEAVRNVIAQSARN